MTTFYQWIPYLVALFALMVWLGQLTSTKRTAGEMITIVSFGMYMAVLGFLTLTPTAYNYGVPTLTPVWFGPVPMNFRAFQGMSMDFYLNIIMTMPLGVYLALWKPLRARKVIAAGIILGLTIEGAQFCLDWGVHLERWVDINDVITNAAGLIVGYAAVALLSRTPFKAIVRFFKVRPRSFPSKTVKKTA